MKHVALFDVEAGATENTNRVKICGVWLTIVNFFFTCIANCKKYFFNMKVKFNTSSPELLFLNISLWWNDLISSLAKKLSVKLVPRCQCKIIPGHDLISSLAKKLSVKSVSRCQCKIIPGYDNAYYVCVEDP
jgi:hypothetical protein